MTTNNADERSSSPSEGYESEGSMAERAAAAAAVRRRRSMETIRAAAAGGIISRDEGERLAAQLGDDCQFIAAPIGSYENAGELLVDLLRRQTALRASGGGRRRSTYVENLKQQIAIALPFVTRSRKHSDHLHSRRCKHADSRTSLSSSEHSPHGATTPEQVGGASLTSNLSSHGGRGGTIADDDNDDDDDDVTPLQTTAAAVASSSPLSSSSSSSVASTGSLTRRRASLQQPLPQSLAGVTSFPIEHDEPIVSTPDNTLPSTAPTTPTSQIGGGAHSPFSRRLFRRNQTAPADVATVGHGPPPRDSRVCSIM